MQLKQSHKDLPISGKKEGKLQNIWKSQEMIGSKESLSNDVRLELEWQIKQHFTFSDNVTVLGADFQADIKFVPEWWNAFMIH